jgi:hypothetical protein
VARRRSGRADGASSVGCAGRGKQRERAVRAGDRAGRRGAATAGLGDEEKTEKKKVADGF